MTTQRVLTVYSDYKSPYAYLAKDLVYGLERECRIAIDWKPYILDIPRYLGSARVDDAGNLIEENRNAHQWRRVRYSYMDCRREARKQGLVIRGTQKIWDSTLAAAGMLFAQRDNPEVFQRFHDTVFDRFWRRELDIESVPTIAAALHGAGADTTKFAEWVSTGRMEVTRIARDAESRGVFGVPSFVLDGELWWGREHLPDIRALLTAIG